MGKGCFQRAVRTTDVWTEDSPGRATAIEDSYPTCFNHFGRFWRVSDLDVKKILTMEL